MNTPTHDDEATEFERRSRAVFEQSVNDVDAEVRARLRQARVAAIEEVERQHRSVRAWRTWVPAGGLAAAAVTAVVLSTRDKPAGEPQAALAIDDLELLADGGDFEMVNDMDFYAWLDNPVSTL